MSESSACGSVDLPSPTGRGAVRSPCLPEECVLLQDIEKDELNAAKKDIDETNVTKIELRDLGAASEEESKNVRCTDLIYGVNDVPPWYMCLLLGFQHYITMFGSTVSLPFILTPALCMEDDDPNRGHIISTILFVSGLITLLQATFGIRLPIVQGGTFAFLIPTFAVLNLPEWKCDRALMNEMSAENKTEYWQLRMQIIQGSIIVASVFQVIVGYLGIVGLVLRFITPLTIVPAVTMIGLALFQEAADLSSHHWGIAGGTIALMIIFSQYLQNIQTPMVGYNFRERSLRVLWFPFFKLFPVLLTIVIMWIFSAILTSVDVFPSGSPARTDLKLRILYDSPWFRFPYPGQWGVPTVNTAATFGMVAGVLASIVESIGDYYACARLSGASVPPVHAINRGIGTEGIGCILAGLWGSGSGTTSYSENIGAIGVTKVGSRRVIQYGALLMIGFGTMSKFGAFFLTIPTPIIGGIFFVMFGMITAVGLSPLQFVNLNSTRNLFILGFSIFFSLALPKWMKENEEKVHLNSQVLEVLLKISMFVGGFTGCFLDNTIPGTPEERGLTKWREQLQMQEADTSEVHDITYDFPFGMDFLQRHKWSSYVPFFPTYKEWKIQKLTCHKKLFHRKTDNASL